MYLSKQKISKIIFYLISLPLLNIIFLHQCLFLHNKILNYHLNKCFNHQGTSFGKKTKLNKLPNNFFLYSRRPQFLIQVRRLHVIFIVQFHKLYKQLNEMWSLSLFSQLLSLLISTFSYMTCLTYFNELFSRNVQYIKYEKQQLIFNSYRILEVPSFPSNLF